MGPHQKTKVVATASSSDLDNSSSRAQSPKVLAATPSMCHYCFDTLIDTVQNGSSNKKRNNSKRTGEDVLTMPTITTIKAIPEFVNDLPDASLECPIFVTWEKRKKYVEEESNNNDNDDDDTCLWQLRGCIGTLAPRLLASAVGEFALTSALRDHRFHPIGISEISTLRVSVSLLVDYEECKDVYDWTIGVHGILIKFVVKGHSFSSTYLPEVAKQQQWDHERAISSLINKSGYSGIVTNDLLKSIHCTRYQSSKSQVTFDEYVLHSCDGNNPISDNVRKASWSPCNSM